MFLSVINNIEDVKSTILAIKTYYFLYIYTKEWMNKRRRGKEKPLVKLGLINKEFL